ncbi:MAG: HpsJ family protein [Cyanobacteriota bacterium]|jgi:hypothetical protein
MKNLKYTVRRFFKNTDFLAPVRRQQINTVFSARDSSRFIVILGFFGYFITLMNLIDCIYVLIPPQIQNPVWELATINTLLSQVWFFLVGFGLILTSYILRYHFYPESKIRGFEIVLFRWLRWLILSISVICLLIIPLIVFDTIRVHRINTLQIKDSTQQRLNQLTEAEQRLERTTNLSQLQSLVRSDLPIDLDNSFTAVKAKLQNSLRSQKEQVLRQSEISQADKKTNLLKSSSRNVIAALIAFSTLFFMFWKTLKAF